MNFYLKFYWKNRKWEKFVRASPTRKTRQRPVEAVSGPLSELQHGAHVSNQYTISDHENTLTPCWKCVRSSDTTKHDFEALSGFLTQMPTQCWSFVWPSKRASTRCPCVSGPLTQAHIMLKLCQTSWHKPTQHPSSKSQVNSVVAIFFLKSTLSLKMLISLIRGEGEGALCTWRSCVFWTN